jgi:hypothetical protein
MNADADPLARPIRKMADEDDPAELFSQQSDTGAKRLDRYCRVKAGSR